jgi:dienelactone hydrolase
LYTADFFVANGIAALTYDKRGTGESDGDFTMDFRQLARDVVAAVEYLKTRTDIDAGRIGLSGYSQGGWVGPLAASMSSDVRYVIVNYGMVESPAEEARLETRQLLRKRGVEEHHMEEVDELTRAAVHVVATRFGEGWDEFGAAKKKYGDALWRDKLDGSPIDGLLKYPKWLIKLFGRGKLPPGLDWYYDSTGVLDGLTVPTVWLLGEKDESAPNELTIPALNGLQAEGKPIELVVFPGADHGMILYREEDGRRVYTGYSPGYWPTEVGVARRLSGLERDADNP